MNNTLKIILSICIFAKTIQPGNLETGSGGALEQIEQIELVGGRDYHSDDYNNNDDNSDHDNGDNGDDGWVSCDDPNRQPGQNCGTPIGELVIILVVFIAFIALGCIPLACLIRCTYFECHLPSFFGSQKATFPKPENQMKYNTRLELKSSTPVFIRKPMTSSISFELMSVKYDRLILRGCSPSLPNNVREITVCLHSVNKFSKARELFPVFLRHLRYFYGISGIFPVFPVFLRYSRYLPFFTLSFHLVKQVLNTLERVSLHRTNTNA